MLLTEIGVEPGLNLLLRGPFIDFCPLRSQCDQGRAHGLYVTGFNLKDEIVKHLKEAILKKMAELQRGA